MYVHID